jgi:tetratricopeptide (TPR) repeat protein
MVVFVACGLGAWALSEMPFGTTFNSLVYAAVAGLVVALGAWGFRLLLSSVPLKVVGSVLLLAAVTIASGVGVLVVDSRIILGRGIPKHPTAGEWRADLDYLAQILPERHPAWFDLVTPAAFSERVDALRSAIPGMDDNAVKAELAGVVAAANCAHTFPNIYSFELDWHIFPIQLYDFDDGMYVVDAGREYRDLVGLRLVAIGGRDLADVSTALRRYLAAENDYAWRDRFSQVGLLAEWLHAAGVIESTREADLTFTGADGARTTVTVKSAHYIPCLYWSMMRTVDSFSPPPVPNDRKDCYRFDFIESNRTLYLMFNHTRQPEDGESMDRFIELLDAWIDENEFDRFVVDVRTNDGGDSDLGLRLAQFIAGHNEINGRGKLFVVIGRKTFSAAVMFSAYLENNTDAVFVGSPTGQGPLFYGSPQVLTLPNSGVEFLVASNLAQSDLRCKYRDAIYPDIATGYTHQDFLSGKDPAMDAILAHQPPASRRAASAQAVVERYAGRYQTDACRALIVEEVAGVLTMVVTDFMDNTYSRLSSPLYRVTNNRFESHIDGIVLLFPDAGGAVLVCGDDEFEAARMADGDRHPLELFRDGLVSEGVEAVLADSDTYVDCMENLERVLNGLGYQYLGEDRIPDAILVFELNTKLYPESANTYDSLGESYVAIGDNQLAIKNYEKSVELNPDNENAKEMQKKLK